MNGKDTIWSKEDIVFIEEAQKDIIKLKKERVFDGKSIVLIGSWIKHEQVKDMLEVNGLNVSFIADNNPQKQGIMKAGVITRSVESIENNDSLRILVYGYHSGEICTQLQKNGFKREQDYFILASSLQQEKIAGHVLNDRTWKEYKECAERGYYSYCKMREIYGDISMWLMHQPSLGDLYMFSIFLPYVYGKNNISECDCLLIVSRNSTKKLAEIIGYKNIELIPLEEASKDWLFMMRLMGDKVNVRNAVFHGLSNSFLSIVPYSSLTFRDGIEKFVLGLNGNTKPLYPIFPSREKHIKKQFKELNLIEDRTVVISPYAGHFVPAITDEQWKMMAIRLKQMGYSVCTNCGSPDEKPIEGTVSAYIDLRDCIAFMERAGYFIGVRSGLCDLICMSECKKHIIYEKNATNNSIAFFGFQNMRIGKNIVEYENDRINTNLIMNEILETFSRG